MRDDFRDLGHTMIVVVNNNIMPDINVYNISVCILIRDAKPPYFGTVIEAKYNSVHKMDAPYLVLRFFPPQYQ